MTNETVSIGVALLQLGTTVYYIHRSRALREADTFKDEVERLTTEVVIIKTTVRHLLDKLGMADTMDG